jgi:hypothetical protein
MENALMMLAGLTVAASVLSLIAWLSLTRLRTRHPAAA